MSWAVKALLRLANGILSLHYAEQEQQQSNNTANRCAQDAEKMFPYPDFCKAAKLGKLGGYHESDTEKSY